VGVLPDRSERNVCGLQNICLRDRPALSRPRSRDGAGQTTGDIMTLAIMFLLGLTVGGVLIFAIDDGESL